MIYTTKGRVIGEDLWKILSKVLLSVALCMGCKSSLFVLSYVSVVPSSATGMFAVIIFSSIHQLSFYNFDFINGRSRSRTYDVSNVTGLQPAAIATMHTHP